MNTTTTPLSFLPLAFSVGIVLSALSGAWADDAVVSPRPGSRPEDFRHAVPQDPNEPFIPAFYYPYPPESGAISVHTAIEEDAEGTIYLGSCCYDSWSKIFRFHPDRQALEVVHDIGDALGQKHYPTERHSKLHTQFQRGRDGWIYGGSKVGNEYFNERALYGESEFQFPGGAFFRFDPRSGRFENLGVPRPGEGLISLVYDDARNRFWVLTEPRCEMLRIDVGAKGMAVKNFGQLPRFPHRTFGMDAAGNVWMESRPLHLLRIDAETNRIREYPVSGVTIEEWGGPLAQFRLAKRLGIALLSTAWWEHNKVIAISLQPDAAGSLPGKALCEFSNLKPKLTTTGYNVLDEETGRLFCFPGERVSATESYVHLVSVEVMSGAMAYHGRIRIVNRTGIEAGGPLAAMIGRNREILFPGAGRPRGLNWYATLNGAGLYRIGPIEDILARSPRGPFAPEKEGPRRRNAPQPAPPPKFRTISFHDVVPFGDRSVTSLSPLGDALLAACAGPDTWRLARVDTRTGVASVLFEDKTDADAGPFAADILPTGIPGRVLISLRRIRVDFSEPAKQVDGWHNEAVEDGKGGYVLKPRPVPDLLTFFGYPGSRLFAAEVGAEKADLKPLGIPLPGDDLVSSVSVNDGRTVIGFGLISGDLTRVDVEDGRLAARVLRFPPDPKTKKSEPITGAIPFDRLRRRRVPKTLLVLADGRVLGSARASRLFVYSPATDELKALACSVPDLPMREDFASLSAAVQTPDGRVFGLTETCRLLELDVEKERVRDLGKPMRQNGAKGLVYNPADGLLYGACGEEFGLDRLFTFDPKERTFGHLGVLCNPLAHNYEYRYATVGAMAVTASGEVAVGEADALADIEFWPARMALQTDKAAKDP